MLQADFLRPDAMPIRLQQTLFLLMYYISKKNQFALFAFQRTLHLLAAFCGTIFLKLCNQKTRFILRLI